jgi:hypothetical protein
MPEEDTPEEIVAEEAPAVIPVPATASGFDFQADADRRASDPSVDWDSYPLN